MLTSSQKIAPVFVLLVIAGAIGYSLLPFRFADDVDCGAPLFGAKALSAESSPRGFIRPVEDCLASGRSRLAVSAVAAFVAALAGTAMVGLRPLSAECLSGSHDACGEWWPGLMGGGGNAFGCQCDCHTAW